MISAEMALNSICNLNSLTPDINFLFPGKYKKGCVCVGVGVGINIVYVCVVSL